MPSIESIDQFKKLVQRLGKEPEIRQKMGVPMEDIQPPLPGLDPQVSDLLESSAAQEGKMDEFLSQRLEGEGSTEPGSDVMDVFENAPDEPEGSSFDDLYAPDQEALAALGLREGDDFPEANLGDTATEEDLVNIPEEEDGLGEMDALLGGYSQERDDLENEDFDLDDALGELNEEQNLEEEGAGGFIDAFGEEDPMVDLGEVDLPGNLDDEDSLEDDDFDDLPEPDESFGQDIDLENEPFQEDVSDPREEKELDGDFLSDDFDLEQDIENPNQSTQDSDLGEDFSKDFDFDEFEGEGEDGSSHNLEEFPNDLGDQPDESFGPLEDSLEFGEENLLDDQFPEQDKSGLSPDDLSDDFFETPGEKLFDINAGGEQSKDFAFDEGLEDQEPEDFGAPELDSDDMSFEIPGEDSLELGALDEEGEEEEEETFAFDDGELDQDFPELAGFAQISSDGGLLGDDEPEEFNLPDFSSHFGLEEGELDSEFSNLNPANLIQKEPGEKELILNISDEEFMALQRNLTFLPLNLRIAVEETIGEKIVSNEDLSELIRMLIVGSSVRALAKKVQEITGKRVQIPPGYEKGTGIRMDAKVHSLPYQITHSVFPIIRLFIILSIVGAGLTMLVMNFVYTPIVAQGLYQEGLDHVMRGQADQGEEKFNQAVARWRDESWFFRYAQAYEERGNYHGARLKYQQILRPFNQFPLDPETKPLSSAREMDDLMTMPDFRVANYNKKALLDWARLESEFGWSEENPLIGYMRAQRILQPIFRKNLQDMDGLLAQGDNFFRWARSNRESSLEAMQMANQSYSIARQYYGFHPEVFYRFIDFFIFADTSGLQARHLEGLGERGQGRRSLEDELLLFKDMLFQTSDMEIRPRSIGRLAGYLIDRYDHWLEQLERLERAGYLTDRNDQVTGKDMDESLEEEGSKYLSRLPDILLRAVETDPSDPLPHYQMARFNRIATDRREEKKALNAAQFHFENLNPMELKDPLLLRARIDTLTRIGEVFWREGETASAERTFFDAQRRFEDGLNRGILQDYDPLMGKIFSNLGNMYYYQSKDWQQSLEYFLKAKELGFQPPQDQFRRGAIYYNTGRYKDSSELFHALWLEHDLLETNPNLIWALGNSLLMDKAYGAAEGYFKILEAQLRARREALEEVILERREDHRGLMEFLVKTRTNLGVSIFRGRAQGNLDNPAAGEVFALFTEAETISDALSREQSALLPMDGSSAQLPRLNLRNMSATDSVLDDIAPFPDLPLDLEQIRFLPHAEGTNPFIGY